MSVQGMRDTDPGGRRLFIAKQGPEARQRTLRCNYLAYPGCDRAENVQGVPERRLYKAGIGSPGMAILADSFIAGG